MSAAPLVEASCRYHPERAGVGICVKCRTVICTECSTRLDGINHCAACVWALQEAQGRERAAAPLWLRALGLLGLCVLVALGSYGVLHMLLLW
jgi:hypothetical protein